MVQVPGFVVLPDTFRTRGVKNVWIQELEPLNGIPNFWR